MCDTLSIFGIITHKEFYMTEEKVKAKKPFYKRWWFIAWMIIVVVAALGGGESEKNTSSSTANTKSAAPPKISSKPVKENIIGDTVKAGYFEITVNSAGETTNALCEYVCESPGKGNKFIFMDVTLLNTDDEGRMLLEGGTMFAAYNGKNLKFDESELVMQEGWLNFSDTANPLVSLNGKVAFKVPEMLKLDSFQYQPPRSNVRISLKK